LVFSDNIRQFYIGDFENGKRTGKGKLVYVNGEVYEGDYFGDKRTGRGKFTFLDGSIYEGEYLNNIYLHWIHAPDSLLLCNQSV
jgi:hypothetical protein